MFITRAASQLSFSPLTCCWGFINTTSSVRDSFITYVLMHWPPATHKKTFNCKKWVARKFNFFLTPSHFDSTLSTYTWLGSLSCWAWNRAGAENCEKKATAFKIYQFVVHTPVQYMREKVYVCAICFWGFVQASMSEFSAVDHPAKDEEKFEAISQLFWNSRQNKSNLQHRTRHQAQVERKLIEINLIKYENVMMVIRCDLIKFNWW